MRRIISNSYYEFVYVLEHANSSINTIIFNQSSIYSYEFLVDDRNIGGTIHVDLKTVVQVQIYILSYDINRYLTRPTIQRPLILLFLDVYQKTEFVVMKPVKMLIKFHLVSILPPSDRYHILKWLSGI